ncbi:cation transporter [Neisseria weixii]|uniref:Cation transporter n=1 Tax=Neisseria weixii TaxID=1853276 RepID=A0A3N4N2K0_9NEIS|nr:cation transporter [Neisseria weixii]RPD89872.1 cation transporter [Neisseria weixii]
MQKSVFHISKMDCPSEEQMIRMKLSAIEGIHALEFDVPNRRMTAYHHGSADEILQALVPLNFISCLESSGLSIGQLADNAQDHKERNLLWQVLAINLFFFVFESVSGWLAGSMGLLADSLDMLADSLVYGMALLAVGTTVARKKLTARAAGYLQLVLAIWGFSEVVLRFFGWEDMPDAGLMIGVSLLALAGNALCLYLLQKSKSREAHMQASMIFTSNDVIMNLGVIAAGILTLLTHSAYPDLIIGLIVFGLVARGSVKILQLAKQ